MADYATVLMIGGPIDGTTISIENDKDTFYICERVDGEAIKKAYHRTEIDKRIFQYNDEIVEKQTI